MSRALGRYELVRPLARGGMAEVFLARRRAGGVEKLLVVKRIRAERANDVRFQELFKREAKLSMSLAHQNIVPVFDFGRIGDRFFLAMERVEGKDLGSSLAEAKTSLPPLVAAFIAAECCQALDYAHRRKNPDGTSRNIVHRDVTPRNVLLSWSGEVKLTDFGIASLAGEDSTKLVGTPAYMAPEQARSETVDVRADIYALGMVLREAMTAQRARPGDSHEALLANARTGTLSPWPPNELDPALVAIADRATAATAADRYAEIHEMLADLDAYIVAERAKKRGDSPARQIASWLARVWGPAESREDSAETLPEPGEFMSFLDDADSTDAIGTGTQRSLAATAADEEAAPVEENMASPGEAKSRESVAGVSKVVESKTDKSSATDSTANDAKAVGSKAGESRESESKAGESSANDSRESESKGVGKAVEETAGDSEPNATEHIGPARRSRRGALVAVAVVAASAAVVLWIATRNSGSKVPDAAIAIAERDAASLVPDAHTIAEPPPAVDAAIAPSTTEADAAIAVVPDAPERRDAAVIDPDARRTGSNRVVRAGSGSANRGTAAGGSGVAANRGSAAGSGSGSAIRAGSGSGSAVVVSRKVRINATPWAYFSVDGGPRMQTPKLLELTPGPHRIHFENDVLKVTRDVTLDVPADRDISYVEPLR